ncbi:MAG: hypothetical protein ACI82Q_001294 [Nonlabens sp.]|jgi:hypothetical protein
MKRIKISVLMLLGLLVGFLMTNSAVGQGVSEDYCWSAEVIGQGGYYRCVPPNSKCQWIDDKKADGDADECLELIKT